MSPYFCTRAQFRAWLESLPQDKPISRSGKDCPLEAYSADLPNHPNIYYTGLNGPIWPAKFRDLIDRSAPRYPLWTNVTPALALRALAATQKRETKEER